MHDIAVFFSGFKVSTLGLMMYNPICINMIALAINGTSFKNNVSLFEYSFHTGIIHNTRKILLKPNPK